MHPITFVMASVTAGVMAAYVGAATGAATGFGLGVVVSSDLLATGSVSTEFYNAGVLPVLFGFSGEVCGAAGGLLMAKYQTRE